MSPQVLPGPLDFGSREELIRSVVASPNVNQPENQVEKQLLVRTADRGRWSGADQTDGIFEGDLYPKTEFQVNGNPRFSDRGWLGCGKNC